MEGGPFDQPSNCAVITLRQIMYGGAPILHVAHDTDELGWQFLDGGVVRMGDAMVVGLGTILKMDPSIRELADLPPGWQAWRRSVGTPWVREPNPSDAEPFKMPGETRDPPR